MSEEVKTEEQKAKQYLLMADQMTMVFLSKLMPGMKFVEVEGMKLDNKPEYQALVSPISIPKEEVVEDKPVILENA